MGDILTLSDLEYPTHRFTISEIYMKKILILAMFLLPNLAQAKAPSVDSIAFAAKHSFDSNLVKDVDFIQGNNFKLGSKKMAYNLYFHGTVKGVRQNIKVNCKADIQSGNIEYCKPVKIEPIR
jgi:hypothetical protein